jgi:amino acid transporter
MIAVLSVGNSSIYGSSRTLAALAEQHQAPQILGYIDRKGRPLVSILLTSAIGLIAYTAVMNQISQNNVFNWLLALSGLSSIFTWLTICLCHIRFRAAWKLAGHTLDELPFKSQPGVLGSWAGFIFNCLVFVAQFWVGFSPEGYQDMTTGELVVNFFEVYLAAPIIVISYVGYKLWFKTRFVILRDVDLVTGIRDSGEDLKKLKEIDREDFRAMPWWGKV